MTRALFANLTFEYELADRVPPRPARRQCDRWSHVLRLVPGFRDALPIGETSDPDALTVWGMSEPARTAAGTLADDWPAIEIVRAANDKRTSHALELEFEIGLPGASTVDTIGALEECAATCGRWIAKHPFGVSGRERVEGEGPLDDRGRRTAERLLQSADALIFEPRVEIETEWSLHYDVDGDGQVRARGATRLITDTHGVFRGNTAPADAPESLREAGATAAARLGRLGYTGPVGIDAFVGLLDGQRVERPLVEINARMTFGRLALHLAERAGAPLAWHHPASGSHEGLNPWNEQEPRSGRWCLPEWCDPEGRSGTWIEFLSDPKEAR